MNVHDGAYQEGDAYGQYTGGGEALHINDLADGEEALDTIGEEDLGEVDTEDNEEGYAEEHKPVEAGSIGGNGHGTQPGDEHTGIERIDKEAGEPDTKEVATGNGDLCGRGAFGF